jgi:hypothetical protein
MDPRSTLSGRAADRRGRGAHSRRRPPAAVRRPGLCLGVAAVGAALVAVLTGAGPAAPAEAEAVASVSVAEQLGLTASAVPAGATPDLQPLEQIAASRNTREAEQTAAQQAQAAADQAEVARRQAEADATARAAAAAAAAEAASAARAVAAAEQPAAKSAASAGAVSATAVARITNSSGPVKPQVQAAANAVVSHVPGADGITLGGTRPSATDPAGHPSGLALDYMVLSNDALGDAIAQYHIDHWSELGVKYVIWQQRMLSSPTGSWQLMEDRGSPTENHMDHVHVNYLG